MVIIGVATACRAATSSLDVDELRETGGDDHAIPHG